MSWVGNRWKELPRKTFALIFLESAHQFQATLRNVNASGKNWVSVTDISQGCINMGIACRKYEVILPFCAALVRPQQGNCVQCAHCILGGGGSTGDNPEESSGNDEMETETWPIRKDCMRLFHLGETSNSLKIHKRQCQSRKKYLIPHVCEMDNREWSLAAAKEVWMSVTRKVWWQE